MEFSNSKSICLWKIDECAKVDAQSSIFETQMDFEFEKSIFYIFTKKYTFALFVCFLKGRSTGRPSEPSFSDKTKVNAHASICTFPKKTPNLKIGIYWFPKPIIT